MSYRLLISVLILTPIIAGCSALNPTPSTSTTQTPAPVPPVVASTAGVSKEPIVKKPSVKKPVVKKTVSKKPVAHKTKPAAKKTSPHKGSSNGKLTVIGQLEYVKISPGDLILNARIDTGAKNTSLSATDIQEFERDGEKWVKFNIPTGKSKGVELKRPLIRYTAIKNHGEKALRRPVVKLKLKIGSLEQRVEVNLTDRSEYDYDILVGRNFLNDLLAVDVSRKHTQGKPK